MSNEQSTSRTVPERITLAVSLAILTLIVALIALQVPGKDSPPAPVATVEDTQPIGDQFHVVVEVSNEGDQTAADTQITAELVVDGQTSTGDQLIDFLAGGEKRSVVFVFDDDPADGELTVGVSGFTIP